MFPPPLIHDPRCPMHPMYQQAAYQQAGSGYPLLGHCICSATRIANAPSIRTVFTSSPSYPVPTYNAFPSHLPPYNATPSSFSGPLYSVVAPASPSQMQYLPVIAPGDNRPPTPIPQRRFSPNVRVHGGERRSSNVRPLVLSNPGLQMSASAGAVHTVTQPYMSTQTAQTQPRTIRVQPFAPAGQDSGRR